MRNLYFLSPFDPITESDCLFLENRSTYFPRLDGKERVYFVLLPGIAEHSLRERMITSLYPEASFVSLTKAKELLQKRESNDFVVLAEEWAETILDSKDWENPNLLLLTEMSSSKDNIHSRLRYLGKKQATETRQGMYLWTKKAVLDVFSESGEYFTGDVKKSVSEHRFLHSLSVAKTAYQIAERNGLDPILCYHAGLLHDIAKDFPLHEAEVIMEKNFPLYAPCPSFAIHQFIGAYLAKTRYHAPRDVIDMIEFHCTGKASMTEYMKCLYAADEVEPLREFETEEKRRKCMENLDEGFLYLVRQQVAYFLSKGIDYQEYPLAREKYEYYLNEKE